MYRKDLIPILLGHAYSITDLARLLGESPKGVEQDLLHVIKSLRRMPYRTVIVPARCRHCGFTFGEDKLRKPGKCPKCKSTWIHEPLISIKEL